MEHFDELSIIKRIEELKALKNWSNYELAKQSNISQSTIAAMLNTPHVPTISNLAKICNGFGISLSEFFNYLNDDNDDTLDIIDLWNALDARSKNYATIYMKGLAKIQAGGEKNYEKL